MRLTSISKGVMLLAGAMALGGCVKLDGQINGGGTMNSLGGKGKAVFTVNAKRCDGQLSGHVNFQDKTAIDYEDIGGVSFKANVIGAGLCGSELVGSALDAEDPSTACQQLCEPGFFEVNFDYTSTNPNAPGEGRGFVCMLDTGEGANRAYDINGMVRALIIQSGPYHTYWNQGSVSGNLNAKECGGPADDEETNG
ncbi:hypothetical protein LZP69_09215 [Shewanella sp. AS1]|uniref:hypothetical protein n=1 Tax=Shewanella sp. AS1 TaxID=2907626 RepID=UPI001F41D652|nr:hypothetical protein [Shewanella sp. AS1]MCE9679353.1 hypothetical protein [Shewanella sp. AS1]